jgi:hypothetical protein
MINVLASEGENARGKGVVENIAGGMNELQNRACRRGPCSETGTKTDLRCPDAVGLNVITEPPHT